jgi:hypothetical protein
MGVASLVKAVLSFFEGLYRLDQCRIFGNSGIVSERNHELFYGSDLHNVFPS